MKTIRQDAWTEEDDMQLADLTLRHIREGSTQLAAFEEAAAKLGRTAAACGYRWNACVRKQYAAAVDIAKSQRKETKLNVEHRFAEDHSVSRVETYNAAPTELSWNAVLRFLRQYKNEYQITTGQVRQLEKDNELYDTELQEFRKQNERLTEELRRLTEEYSQMSRDYRILVAIMERARQLTVLEEPEREQEERSRFRMDQGGNLERVE